jgi:hypothetical protein
MRRVGSVWRHFALAARSGALTSCLHSYQEALGANTRKRDETQKAGECREAKEESNLRLDQRRGQHFHSDPALKSVYTCIKPDVDDRFLETTTRKRHQVNSFLQNLRSIRSSPRPLRHASIFP